MKSFPPVVEDVTYNRQDRHSRIVLLDVLRALALLGIVLAHSHDHFNCYVYPETSSPWLGSLNLAANWINETFLTGKAFILFAFLFGVSFFIQLDRSDARGVDFRLKFVWRVTLLFFLGLFHTIFYDGDILTIFAVQGLLLIPFYKTRASIVLLIGLVSALCLPALVVWLKYQQHDHYLFTYGWENEGGARNNVYLNGSFCDVARWNFLYGQSSKWKYIIESGRIGQTFGFFMLGLWAGKKRIFETCRDHSRFFKKLIACTLPSWLVCQLAVALKWHEPFDVVTVVVGNLCFVASLAAFVTLVSQRACVRPLLDFLAPVGKMTLTSYILQSIFFCFFFYGWGLQMAPKTGYFTSMLAAALFFTLQAFTASWWLARYRYGPLEWLWRSGTYRSWQSFRR